MLCAVSREALDDWFEAEGKGQEGYLVAFRKHRAIIQAVARAVYLHEKVPPNGMALVKTADVSRLRAKVKTRS